jgi:uncharacterized protein (DUF1684 family)
VDLELGRPPGSFEQSWCCNHDSGADNQRYRDAFAHIERIGNRRDTEYTQVGVVTTPMDTEALLQDRKDKDEFFKLSPHSPIPAKNQGAFAGLSYFDPNPDLVFTVEPEHDEPTEITIQTTTGDPRIYHRIANATIDIDETAVTLAIYSSGHDSLFLPFRDATSGRESYGAGRYLDIGPNEDGTITIDFNYAYAPFCAYSDQYSCALPPQENWMTVSVEAGERTRQ